MVLIKRLFFCKVSQFHFSRVPQASNFLVSVPWRGAYPLSLTVEKSKNIRSYQCLNISARSLSNIICFDLWILACPLRVVTVQHLQKSVARKTQNKLWVLLELACLPEWETAEAMIKWDIVLHVHESINEDFLPAPSWILWLIEIWDQLMAWPSRDCTAVAFSSSPLVPLSYRTAVTHLIFFVVLSGRTWKLDRSSARVSSAPSVHLTHSSSPKTFEWTRSWLWLVINS